jgi:hypothetical protein
MPIYLSNTGPLTDVAGYVLAAFTTVTETPAEASSDDVFMVSATCIVFSAIMAVLLAAYASRPASDASSSHRDRRYAPW